MRNKLNILISGSLAIDRIMDFPGRFSDHILPDKIHNLNVCFNVDCLKESFGGTAGNIAFNLGLLGERPVVLATAGKDFGEYVKWLRTIRSENTPFSRCGTRPANGRGSNSPRFKNGIFPDRCIDLSQIKIIKDQPTASAYIITDKADNQIAGFHRGAMAVPRGKFDQKNINDASNSLAIISPGNLADTENYARLYQKKKVKYIFDPGQSIPVLDVAALKMGCAGAQIVIGNDYEIEMIKRRTGWTTAKLLDKVNWLIITKGDKGSEIFGPANLRIDYESTKISAKKAAKRKGVIKAAKPKKVVDPTGAGDAYRAGLIKGLVLGWDMGKSAKLASVVASYPVEKYGTQNHRFGWNDLAKRYWKTYGKNLDE